MTVEQKTLKEKIDESTQRLRQAGIKEISPEMWEKIRASQGLFSATPMNLRPPQNNETQGTISGEVE